MVKMQKPVPKSIKRDVTEIKKSIIKNKVKFSNEKLKSVKKSLASGAKNEVDVKQNVLLNKKLKKVLEKANEAPQNRKPINAKLKKSVQKKVLKKSLVLGDEQETVKKNGSVKKPVAEKTQKKVKNAVPKKKQFISEMKDNKGVKAAQTKNLFSEKVKKKVPSTTKVRKSTSSAAKVVKKIESTVKNKRQKEVVCEAAGEVAKKVEATVKNKSQNEDGCVKKILKINLDENIKPEEKETKSPINKAEEFNEENFEEIVSLENIKKICKALKLLVKREVSEKKTSIFSDYTYFLNVASYKIPNCPKRMVKLKLSHALVDIKTDDVVIFVPDLKRGAKVDYEPTIQHYEDLLREIGMENIKVMPFNQLRNECSSFEAKRKLANTYDYFLCDGRIVGHVVGFLGKPFQKPRTTIHSVRLANSKTYKSCIENALRRTAYRQIAKGDLISIPVGNHICTIKQLAENVKKVIEQLKTLFPGGYGNIRNMNIKIDIKGTSSLPLYVNLSGAPDEVPNVIGPREERMIKLKKQANDILSKFNIGKAGDFIKLNEAQIKSKQEMREARVMLLSEKNNEIDKNNSECDPPLRKKLKKHENNSKDDNELSNEEEDGGISEGDVDDKAISDKEHKEMSDEEEDIEVSDEEEDEEISEDDENTEISEEE